MHWNFHLIAFPLQGATGLEVAVAEYHFPRKRSTRIVSIVYKRSQPLVCLLGRNRNNPGFMFSCCASELGSNWILILVLDTQLLLELMYCRPFWQLTL